MTSIERPDLHVITTCVEAGVDFSFHPAFRESWELANLPQLAGRAAPSGIADWRLQISDSVQIWSNRLKSGDWPLKPIGPEEELWAWTGQNDNSFLGYMADVLPLLQAGAKGFEPL